MPGDGSQLMSLCCPLVRCKHGHKSPKDHSACLAGLEAADGEDQSGDPSAIKMRPKRGKSTPALQALRSYIPLFIPVTDEGIYLTVSLY